MLTVHKVFRRLPGGPGVFLPEVLPGKEDRGAPFQNTVIDTGVGQVGRIFEFGQLQVGGDNHGTAAAVAAVNDEKHLLHRILGAALHTQIVNDKQVVFVKAGDKVGPILGKHPGQAVQEGDSPRRPRTTTCLNCGIEFQITGKKVRKYCCVECYQQHQLSKDQVVTAQNEH